MAKGFEGVRKEAEEVEARRSSGSGPGALWFKLPDSGDTATVRFIDEDPTYCYVHVVPVEGRAWGDDIPCLDQDGEGTDCPGCEADLKRKFKGWIRLIWNEAPLFKRDDDNKIVKDRTGDVVIIGEEPQVAIWNSGIRVFEDLDEADANYKGLTSRTFKVKRKGLKLDTKYIITPADPDGGAQKMTKAEIKLAEGDLPDLNEFIVPPSYDEFTRRMNGGGRRNNGGGGGGGGGGSKKSKSGSSNPFISRRNDDEE